MQNIIYIPEQTFTPEYDLIKILHKYCPSLLWLGTNKQTRLLAQIFTGVVKKPRKI